MNNDAFEQKLKGMFADVEPPEALSPESIPKLLEKRRKPPVRIVIARVAGIAAAFALILYSASYLLGVASHKTANDEASAVGEETFDTMTAAGSPEAEKQEVYADVSDDNSVSRIDGEADPRDLDGDGVVTDEEIEEYERLNGGTP